MNISNELLQGIANYLSKQPYAEVAGLINALQKEVAVKPEEEVKEETEEKPANKK